MIRARSISDALRQVKSSLWKSIDAALADEVAGVVQNAEAVSAATNFYAKYQPRMYARRFSLQSKENMPFAVANHTLTVYARAKPNPVIYRHGVPSHSTTPMDSSLARLANDGVYNPHGYGYDFAGEWCAPRPYISEAVEDLRGSKDHVTAMRAGLISRGLRVE